jgi:hypothetical protein
MPTIAQYLPQVIAAAGPGAARTYGSYWTRMQAAWGDRRVDSITASDIEALQRQAIAVARERRTNCGGRHVVERVIAAARAQVQLTVAEHSGPPDHHPAAPSGPARAVKGRGVRLSAYQENGPQTEATIQTAVRGHLDDDPPAGLAYLDAYIGRARWTVHLWPSR